ncbi:MAG TPA: NAD-dependent epimerase/dehydratase family protein [Bacteroidales bacterium]|nr:NAD-dependent epimerase/dehydratase family protein [Lentimicrobiaceae bacterium]HOI00003.1 NAD-dependent epimerase/dehydratase family protein [Bacteroidales bacterium]
MKRILIVGAVGQIGSELTMELRNHFGSENVVAGGRKTAPSDDLLNSGPFAFMDVADRNSLREVAEKYEIDTIINMAAILSATGEENPHLAWNVNMNGLYNVLEVAREMKMDRVLVPSSIAVFGPETPRENTPQETVLKPTTMYGVTKVAGELLGDYYVRRFGLDVRGLRYPGIISAETLPGGGTTDYAVAIYYDAIKYKKYTCFVREDTRLPMMYMPDCLKATLDLLQAPFESLKHHCDFNVGSMSFSAGELAASIKKYIPDFEIEYKPDHRQKIADSWPQSVDDSAARAEWGWNPSFDLDSMTRDMLEKLSHKLK